MNLHFDEPPEVREHRLAWRAVAEAALWQLLDSDLLRPTLRQVVDQGAAEATQAPHVPVSAATVTGVTIDVGMHWPSTPGSGIRDTATPDSPGRDLARCLDGIHGLLIVNVHGPSSVLAEREDQEAAVRTVPFVTLQPLLTSWYAHLVAATADAEVMVEVGRVISLGVWANITDDTISASIYGPYGEVQVSGVLGLADDYAERDL